MRKEVLDEICNLIKPVQRYIGNYVETVYGTVCFYNAVTDRVEVVNEEGLQELKTKGCGTPATNKREVQYGVRRHWDSRLHLSQESIKDFKKKYPYSGIDTYASFNNTSAGLGGYMALYLQNPSVEQIAKIHPLLIQCVDDENDVVLFNRNFKKGKNMKEITGMPDRVWRYLVDSNADLKTWNFIRIWNKQSTSESGNPLDDNDLESLMKISGRNASCLSKFKYIVKNAVDDKGKKVFSISKLVRYLERVDMYQAIELYSAIEILQDYIRMCKDMGVTPITDSNSLKREHDVMARLYSDFARAKYAAKEEERNRQEEEKFKQVYPELEKYSFEDSDLKVLVPHTPMDMIQESIMNHNCLSSYIHNFAEGKTNIFFIRRKEELDKSYITVELNSTMCDYRQAYYSCNQPVTKKSDLTFIKNWMENNKKLRLQNA